MGPGLVVCSRGRRLPPVCSYCGCESEEVIATLMADHARIAELVYRVRRALDGGQLDCAEALTTRLAEQFDRHSRYEEAGLFRQVRMSGEGTKELDSLEQEHRTLRPGLRQERLVEQPARLRALLDELTRHAEAEDSDFFPFVLQSLPNNVWEALAVTVPAH
jgi:hemerythrin-like domain-containing protein